MISYQMIDRCFFFEHKRMKEIERAKFMLRIQHSNI